MHHAIITVPGASQALLKELAELDIKAKAVAQDWAEANLSEADVRVVQLRSQLATRVLKLIGVTTTENLISLASTHKPQGSFAVRAQGEERQSVQEDVGAAIHDTSGAKVDLERPDELLYCYQSGGEWLFGIDLLGDLSKRHYKIINTSQSMAGPVAAAVLRIAGWQPKADLLIWPCATGELAIEAALWASTKSPRAYELKMLDATEPGCKIIAADPHLGTVRICEKNSRVAGVHPYIRFSRQDADWLDTKHEEHGVPYCIGLLPNIRFHPKLPKELFYQLDYILTKKGVAAFACVNEESCQKIEEAAKGYTCQRLYVWQGKQALTIVHLQRN